MEPDIQPEIRLATESDCNEIHRLLLELADYEKLKHDVHITPKDLQKDGFGPKRRFRCLVADANQDGRGPERRLAGYCMFYTIFSSRRGRGLNMEDIYVTPQGRKKGLGTKFIKELAKVAVRENCSYITWEVLDWNQGARDFYSRLGATDRTCLYGSQMFKMDLSDIQKLALSYRKSSYLSPTHGLNNEF